MVLTKTGGDGTQRFGKVTANDHGNMSSSFQKQGLVEENMIWASFVASGSRQPRTPTEVLKDDFKQPEYLRLFYFDRLCWLVHLTFVSFRRKIPFTFLKCVCV